MDKLKNQAGIASIFLILIILILLGISTWITVDLLDLVEIPEEYSIKKYLTKFANVEYEFDEDNVEKRIVKRKKSSNTSSDEDDGEYDINVGTIVGSDEDEYDAEYISDEDDLYIYRRYYYMQLDSVGKQLYDGIIDNLEEIKSGKYTVDFGEEFNDLLNSEDGEEILNNHFQSALNAVLLDNPDIFYLDITKMYLLTKSTTYAFFGTTYEVSIGPVDDESYLSNGFSASSVDKAVSNLENIKGGIIRNATGDTVNKIKKVHDYLVDNLEYDSTFENDNIYNMYGALVNNLTVCEGYAKAFKSIMDDLEIPCVVVCGYAQNSKGETENHAWNYVMIDNEWYAIDTTWDDPIIIGGGVASKESKYKYFLRGSEYMESDHEEDGELVKGANFSYPNLSKIDY